MGDIRGAGEGYKGVLWASERTMSLTHLRVVSRGVA